MTETMAQLLIAAFQAFWRAVDHRLDDRRRFFADHIEPLYRQINVIHQDYVSSFEQLRRLAADPTTPVARLSEVAEERRKVLAHAREECIALTKATVGMRRAQPGGMSAVRPPEAVHNFLMAISQYLQYATDDQPLAGGRSAYRGVLHGFQILAQPKYSYSARDLVAEVSGKLDSRWQDLTNAYAVCRTELLA